MNKYRHISPIVYVSLPMAIVVFVASSSSIIDRPPIEAVFDIIVFFLVFAELFVESWLSSFLLISNNLFTEFFKSYNDLFKKDNVVFSLTYLRMTVSDSDSIWQFSNTLRKVIMNYFENDLSKHTILASTLWKDAKRFIFMINARQTKLEYFPAL